MSCPHGFPSMTEQECSFSPSHHVKNKKPQEVIDEFLNKMLAFARNLEDEPIDRDESTLNLEQNDEKAGLDIYGASVLPDNSPILVFVHGGYWIEGSKDYGKSMVKTLVSDGAIVAVVGYNLSPKVTIPQIVDEVAEQLEFIIEWSKRRLPRERCPIHLMGHSAGAQLIFQVLLKLPKALGEYVQSLILISGVYDLNPLIETEMNKSLKLDEHLARSLSPINFAGEIDRMYGARLEHCILVGADDAPNFVDQSCDFYDTLKQQFNSSESISLHILPNYDHFNIVVGLGCKDESVYKLVSNIIFD